jgi:hypothetical protein
MNLWLMFRNLLRRSPPVVSKAQAISIAHGECGRREWVWREPLKVRPRGNAWVVYTNWGHRGANARIVVSQDTGEVYEASFLPR